MTTCKTALTRRKPRWSGCERRGSLAKQSWKHAVKRVTAWRNVTRKTRCTLSMAKTSYAGFYLNPKARLRRNLTQSRTVTMSRTRTTFGSHANLAHTWAQQTMSHGKSSDARMFFEGATIYSYGNHFPIARFVKRKKGTCVLFTTQGYSVSTSKHISHVRRALRDNATVFHVHDVRVDPTAETIKKAQASLNESVAAFGRTTPYDVDQAVVDFENTRDTVNEMAAFFGIRRRVKCDEIPADAIEKVRVRVAKRTERRRVLDEKRQAQYDAAYAIINADNVKAWREG